MSEKYNGAIAQRALLSLIPSGVGIFDFAGSEIRTEYLNDGYYQLLDTRRELRKAYAGTGAVGAVCPDDLPVLLAEAHASVQENREAECRFRILDGHGQYRWLSVHANHFSVNSQTERFYTSFSDIDELVRTRDRLQTDSMLFRDVLNYSETCHFLYYPHTHGFKFFSLPENLQALSLAPDSPRSLLRAAHISEEDEHKCRGLLQSIDGGAEEAECNVLLQPQDTPGWYRIHLQTVLADGTSEAYAAGTVMNITKLIDTQKAYDRERLRLDAFRDNSRTAAACYDLTRDKVIDCAGILTSDLSERSLHSIREEALADDPEIGAQEEDSLRLLLHTAKKIPGPEQRRQYIRTFSRAGLLSLFANGQRQTDMEFRIDDNARLTWVSLHAELLPDPRNGNTLAFLYASDINDEVVFRRISGRILTLDYISVSYYDLATDKYYRRQEGSAFREIGFSEALENDISSALNPGEYWTARTECCPPHAVEMLKHADRYSVYYTSRSVRSRLPGRESCRIRNDIFYLDENRDVIVYLQSDATEQEETLLKLERADALEETLKNIPAGLLLFKKDGSRLTILMVNDNLCRLLMTDRKSLLNKAVGDSLEQRAVREDLPGIRSALHQLFSDKGESSFTYRTLAADGRHFRWVRVTARAVAQPDGTKLAYALFSDATEQKHQEDEFDRRIREYSSVNPNTLAIFHMDLTTGVFAAGQGYTPVFTSLASASTVEEFFRGILSIVCNESDRRTCAGELATAKLLEDYQKGQHDVSCVFRYLNSFTDEVRWAAVYCYMEKNPRNGDIEAVASIVDTHHAVVREQVLRLISDEDYDFSFLLELRNRSVHFLSMRNHPEFRNIGTRSNYEHVLEESLRLIPDPADREQFLSALCFEKVTQALQKQNIYEYSYSLHDKDGTDRHKLTRCRWLDDTHDFILFIRQDTTSTYIQEQQQVARLREALHEAEAANRAKTEFLSRISHDIRTPIGISMSMTDFAIADLNDRAKLEEDLDKIRSANAFLLSLVNDVLDISKIDSGKIELIPEPYPFDEYTTDIRNVLVPMCQAKGIHFSIERRQVTKGCIVADRTRLRQITLNLLSNAVKFTPQGGTVTYVSESEDQPDGKFRFGFLISDNGIGMSPAFQKVMFEPFSQEYDNPARPKGMTGTGLGLPIVKKLVDLMGGTIEVNSEPGKGTSIRCTFVFPDATQDPAYANAARNAAAASASEPEKLQGHILIVEDNVLNAEISARIADSYGLTSDVAENGQAAVEMFEHAAEGTYAAILMDIQMPVMDGYEATRKIRALKRSDAGSVAIIAMTADAYSAAVDKCREAGMTAYLTKPLDSRKLHDTLQKYLPPVNTEPHK
ncbi:MAG: ATP-binding protein [Lachnospiraceae bacterium]|nr:ATP-binding protein [Lachnospiraceae bacterium]